MTTLAVSNERFSLFGRRPPRRPVMLDEIAPQPLPDPALEARADQISKRNSQRVEGSVRIAKDIDDLIQAYLKRFA